MNFECHQKLESNLEEIQLLADRADAVLQDQSEVRRLGNAMTRAGLVLLSGSFEGFVRDLVEECIEVINDNNLELESLPDPVFCSVLENFSSKYRRDEKSIKESVRPNCSVKLEKGQFSKTGGNPTVDTIEKIFNGLGVSKVIDKLTIRDYSVDSTFLAESHLDVATRGKISSVIASHAPEAPPAFFDELVKLIDKKWTPRQKRRQIGYVSEIEQLLAKRNRIAHGESGEQITPNELRNFINMVRRLAQGLCDLTSDLLSRLNVNAT